MSGQWVIRPGAIGGLPHERDMWCVNHGCRPLVVIDPEDREQVEAVVAGFFDNMNAREMWAVGKPSNNAMQAALRSLLEPPKPDEPIGLGAVVEDANGATWVRYSDESGSFWISRHGMTKPYRLIAAIRVLSEGVSDV